MTAPHEHEPVDGMTVSKTRRVVFTALAVLAFLLVVPFVLEQPQRPLAVATILSASLAVLTTVLLAIAGHTSSVRAIRDAKLRDSGLLIAFTIAHATFLNYRNTNPPMSDDISRLWILIPTTLTVALIIHDAWWQAIQDAAQLAADEDE